MMITNNGTTMMTTSTSTIDNSKQYHHHAAKKLQLQRPQRKISHLRLAMYLVGVMTLSVPYFLISFSSISSSYQQQSSSTINNDCSDDDNNNANANANAFSSILADSKVSSLSSSSSSSSSSLSVHRHDQQQKHQILPPVYSLEHPLNHSPYKILHTVMTRFMVGQSNAKYELARARYLLFESFCWPTIQYQTSRNFFWLVLVDPGLDSSIINDMKSLLNAVPTGNAYMILTNNTAWSADGVGVENVTSYGVGLQTIVEEYTNGKLNIITGNTTYLLRALDWMTKQQQVEEPQYNNNNNNNNIETSKPIMVIETLLDADDGINNHGVEWIQDVAIQRTKEHQQQQQQQQSPAHQYPLHPTLNSTWWFLCGTDHIEWHNRDIFKLTNEEYMEHGITSGLAGLRQSPYFCTSAGFTRIGITTTTTTSTPMTIRSASLSSSSSSSSPFKFPNDAYSNHALAFYFPECTSTNTTTATSTNINNNGNYSHCWRREFSGEAFVLKSRTITSDSMDHMNPRKTDDYRDVAWLNKTDYPLLINETERMWNVLTKEFAIDRHHAWETSTYIFDNRRLILRQNKDSRCSPGFPCYKEAKKNLIRMEKYWLGQTKQAIIDKKNIMDKIHQLAEDKRKRDSAITDAKLRVEQDLIKAEDKRKRDSAIADAKLRVDQDLIKKCKIYPQNAICTKK